MAGNPPRVAPRAPLVYNGLSKVSEPYDIWYGYERLWVPSEGYPPEVQCTSLSAGRGLDTPHHGPASLNNDPSLG